MCPLFSVIIWVCMSVCLIYFDSILCIHLYELVTLCIPNYSVCSCFHVSRWYNIVKLVCIVWSPALLWFICWLCLGINLIYFMSNVWLTNCLFKMCAVKFIIYYTVRYKICYATYLVCTCLIYFLSVKF